MIENGQIINNRYEVLKIIGKGGTSRVYLVVDINIGKKWACKEIPKSKEMAVHVAKQELELLKSLDYPMFPRIVDAFSYENSLIIISDYIEGIALDKILLKRHVSKDTGIKWALLILGALEYLHNLSPPILYLDLKPDNILVLPSGSIKLIDFGIARSIMSSYIPMGTPGFAPPEQYEYGGDNLSERSDIYAFGMTYLAMRTGLRPDSDVEKVRNYIRSSNILTKNEKALINKCIKTNPAQRFGAVEDISYKIRKIKSKRNPGKIINLVGILALMGCVLSVLFAAYISQHKKDEAASQMIAEASGYIEDGEYTAEGIKIISLYLDSGSLDEKTYEAFLLEVSYNYFFIQKDYNLAYRYISQIDKNEYPETEYMMEICRAQNGFGYDQLYMEECIGKIYDYVLKRANDKAKYEMILAVANLFQMYEEDSLTGIKKSMAILDEGLMRLKEEELNMPEDEKNRLIKRYERQINMLNVRAKYMMKG